MKFLLIYGPPAVGKLTVAAEISRLTGMRLFDNHATVNAIQPIFDFDTEPYRRLLRSIRLAIIEEAARQGVSIVHTMVYNHPRTAVYVEQLAEAVGRHNGDFRLLRLTADRAILASRVVNEGRLLRNKMTTASALDCYLATRAADEAIPGRASLTVDNSNLSPIEVAKLSITHYGLGSV